MDQNYAIHLSAFPATFTGKLIIFSKNNYMKNKKWSPVTKIYPKIYPTKQNQ